MVFSDDADAGRLKFGCDCGQFHSGEGLEDGAYAFSSAGGSVRSNPSLSFVNVVLRMYHSTPVA